jgi:uncharacterized membrane protein YphA (DoxX/SURF4 family)
MNNLLGILISGFLYHGLRIFLGGVFLYAAHDKVLNPLAFAKVVFNYQILPEALVNLAALILPFLEMLIGFCLVLGYWLPGATILSTGLLTVFISALGFNLFRGLDVHCGCFSTDSTGAPADFLTVARDVFFLGVSVILWARVFIFREPEE